MSVKALISPVTRLVLPLALSACVVMPRTDFHYDEQCRTLRRHMTLEVHQIGTFGGCANEGCAALLVGVGAVAAASAVVSGSIAVLGNVVFWIERQGPCPVAPAVLPPVLPPVAPPPPAGPAS